jgi:hypothetical protein
MPIRKTPEGDARQGDAGSATATIRGPMSPTRPRTTATIPTAEVVENAKLARTTTLSPS